MSGADGLTSRGEGWESRKSCALVGCAFPGHRAGVTALWWHSSPSCVSLGCRTQLGELCHQGRESLGIRLAWTAAAMQAVELLLMKPESEHDVR